MLTYILGAGASYQSIPIVNTFPKRFKEFVNYLKKWSTYSGDKGESNKKFVDASKFAECLSVSFDSHQSFDTYFKKLFHTKEQSLIKKYKKILNLYFIWEHVQNTEITMDEDGNPTKAYDIFKK